MAAVAGALRERCEPLNAKVLFRRNSPRPVKAKTCAALLWRALMANEAASIYESIAIDRRSDPSPALRLLDDDVEGRLVARFLTKQRQKSSVSSISFWISHIRV
jgi:hypothetical protein|tara:strand:- start:155 stop:466 length:312 start_codon:yes stop_codon:yes gene_type:complete